MTARTASSGSKAHAHEVDANRWRLSHAGVLETWQYREVLFAFIARHLKVKYKQAAIGVGWGVLQPLLASLLLSIVLGRFAHLGSEGVPYFVFALAGFVLWTFFAAALASSAESVIHESSMVRKVYFPRQILPLAAVGATLVDLPAALLFLLGAVLFTGGRPALTWLLIPLPILLILLAATALGLVAAALNVYYRDVRHVLPFIIQVMLFSSPVMYSLRLVPARWREAYEVLNPVAAAIEDLRRLVVHNSWPDPWVNAGALVWLSVLLAGGYYLFKFLERDFADQL
jgi:lipopolysaccharide transport system permease protein